MSIEEREGQAAAGDVKQRRVLGIPGCLSMVREGIISTQKYFNESMLRVLEKKKKGPS